MDDKNNNNELIEELGRTEEPIDNQQNVRFNDDNWLPDPMDAGPGLLIFIKFYLLFILKEKQSLNNTFYFVYRI